MDRTETVKKYLEYQDSGRVDELLGLLSDDAVMVYPMRSATGKAEIADALRSRPGMIKPSYGEIKLEGDGAEVAGTLPEGSPIPAVTFNFAFEGDLIRRVEIKMS